MELERAQEDKPLKASASESYFRFSSRRGTYNTVTFSMVEAMPSILNGAGEEQEPPSPQVEWLLSITLFCLVVFTMLLLTNIVMRYHGTSSEISWSTHLVALRHSRCLPRDPPQTPQPCRQPRTPLERTILWSLLISAAYWLMCIWINCNKLQNNLLKV